MATLIKPTPVLRGIKPITTKAIRKLSLFSGICQSEQLTIETAHKAFGDLHPTNVGFR
jgi:hypothetical protein